MHSNQNRAVSLSDHAQAILLGSLLGDGSLRISKGYRHARFSFRHSSKQEAYFLWKASQLHEIVGEKYIFEQKGDGFGTQPKLRFQSAALPALTELYHLTHERGRLSIRRKWLNRLTPLSLAIWWLDDGSLIVNSRRGVFCTDGFSEAEVKLLARYLQVVWNIQTHVATVGRKRQGRQEVYYRLWIRSSEELQKFLRIILPYVPVEEMLPKVLLLYRDPQLQQRWISELVERTSFSLATVERWLKDKRSRWKQFRK